MGPPRKIDTHVHVGPRGIDHLVALMDQRGIDVAVNLSGLTPGHGLEQQLAAAARHPGRVVVFCNLDWEKPLAGPGYGARMARDVTEARRLGAVGVKIEKGLGLGYTDYTGKLISVDDPELDPIFRTAGELGMPIAIHTGDPVAFFTPANPQNERWKELQAHPGWSFHDKGVPSWEALFAQLERRIARHPGTIFISVHFGNAPEYPERVAALLDKYPNLRVDLAARVPELGRHDPEVMRKILIDHADRVLFGTDLGVGPGTYDLMLGSTGSEPPNDADIERFFSATWRWLETRDKGFAHPTPIQGDWTIDGVGLPPDVLRKIYGGNAEKLLGLARQR